MKIPFGKYQGNRIVDLPSNYLYLLQQNNMEDDTIRNEAKEEWDFREDAGAHFYS